MKGHSACQSTWQALEQLAKNELDLNQLFTSNPLRGSKYAVQACDIYMDFSKQAINDTILDKLLTLADDCDLSNKINELITGKKVNDTENRPALHTALRSPKDEPLFVDGIDVNVNVHDSLDKAQTIVNRIRQKIWRGYTGKAITDVVNIGVGGSDLGPLMATTALDEWADTDIRVHFVSNMDGTQLDSLLKVLNRQTTLFIISSKSFGTIDTLSNAQTALAWLLGRVGRDTPWIKDSILRRHFIGISTRPDKMNEWGIHSDNQLLLWDWVGGRFSMWSVIGLAIAIKIGMGHFYELLAGANQLDRHFATAPFCQNLPVLLGLIGVWNSTFLDINAHTVLPYDGRLSFFPNYLTQLEMESNGKSVGRDGQSVAYSTCPVLWGDIGSNAQHAFYQLLHQGTQRVSCDFITPIHRYNDRQTSNDELTNQHKLSLSNCLAQSQVLAFGNGALPSELVPNDDQFSKFKQYRGNQPSTTLLLKDLNPKTLGALIALYEHKVYVMSVIWHINPFDQWGVEVGKVMANQVYDALTNGVISTGFDSSTNQLLNVIKGAV
ncbi:glucose-6-phosphate isomerase [Moraxella nasovis]|uniref:glucose-6-phosphate isomerase n=1 Tax=Moraxella nasovis TaxID=2904121 RepID=UPI001F610EEE|nr:glucose-6-phosphate isomerase [Moraxella nasovis]UNU72607.1 glucose-6-phosphate isomerase [Moraxella nasovis]